MPGGGGLHTGTDSTEELTTQCRWNTFDALEIVRFVSPARRPAPSLYQKYFCFFRQVYELFLRGAPEVCASGCSRRPIAFLVALLLTVQHQDKCTAYLAIQRSIAKACVEGMALCTCCAETDDLRRLLRVVLPGANECRTVG